MGRASCRVKLSTSITISERVWSEALPTCRMSASRGALTFLFSRPRLAIAVTVAARIIAAMPGEVPVVEPALDSLSLLVEPCAVDHLPGASGQLVLTFFLFVFTVSRDFVWRVGDFSNACHTRCVGSFDTSNASFVVSASS